jgi:Dyp-type peroxidase family
MQGPARGWDVAGAASGVAIVVMLVAFVAAAGATRAGYSQVQDTISRLGASGTPEAWWFTVLNVANFFLILVFAYAVQRRIPLGVWTFGFLAATGIGALFVGGFRCSGQCRAWAHDPHTFAAGFTALMIMGFMLAAAFGAIFHHPAPRPWFRFVSVGLAAVDLLFLVVLFGITLGHGRDAGLFERLFWGAAYLWVLAASLAILLAARRRVRPVEFDPSLLQTKILRSKRAWTHAAYAFYSIDEPALAKKWLHWMIDPEHGVVRPDDGTQAPGSVTVAFSAAGLEALGVDVEEPPALDAFRLGMRARARVLGDDGPSAPVWWQPPWRSEDPHILVWVEAEHRVLVDALLDRIHQRERGIHALAPPQRAKTSGPDEEPPPVGELRFEDGISQPWLPLTGRPGHDERRAPGGALDAFGKWRPLAVGEFVLGELDESGDRSLVPEPKPIFEHGSFVVVRKLAQNFDALERLVASAEEGSPRLGAVGASFAERMMGRRRDGHPLVRTEGQRGHNDFTYAGDPEGLRCPLGAHIRRANPRDALGFGTLMSARHRIIRRGKAYNDDPADAPPGWASGLVFVAVNARIEDQFEFIQRFWLNDGSRQRVGTARDLFAGASSSTSAAVVQFESGPIVIEPVPPLVRTMGGGYFFAPSMAGLRSLAKWPARGMSAGGGPGSSLLSSGTGPG